MKLAGNKAQIFLDSFDNSNVINGDGTITTTAREKWLFRLNGGKGVKVV